MERNVYNILNEYIKDKCRCQKYREDLIMKGYPLDLFHKESLKNVPTYNLLDMYYSEKVSIIGEKNMNIVVDHLVRFRGFNPQYFNRK